MLLKQHTESLLLKIRLESAGLFFTAKPKSCSQTNFSNLNKGFCHLSMTVTLFPQVEKTKHYLLLREKLESTLLVGQDSLLLCVTEEQSESPQLPEVEQKVSYSSEITTERQRELAAKVSHHCFILKLNFKFHFKT